MTGAADRDQPPTVAECVSSVVVGIPVREFDKAIAFHQAWVGREPDVVPMPGMAEWKITDTCYLQFYESSDAGGAAVVRLGVDDVERARSAALHVGVDVSEIEDIGGFLRYAEFTDPEGNKFSLVQELG